jgi:adenylosuccinate synthase
VKNILAQGMVINPKMLIDELVILEKRGFKDYQLFISNKAHVILPYHMQLDGIFEELKTTDKIGTTKKGIGPTYQDKYGRIGIRFCDFIEPELFKKKLKAALMIKNVILKAFGGTEYTVDEIFNEYSKYAEVLKKYVVDTGLLIYDAYENNKSIIFEGAQGVMLCIENGTYPFVTSSSPTASGIPLYTGTNTRIVNNVMGVVKAYTSRVGAGAFPTKIKDKKVSNHLREIGHEYGTVTGRPRQIG